MVPPTRPAPRPSPSAHSQIYSCDLLTPPRVTHYSPLGTARRRPPLAEGVAFTEAVSQIPKAVVEGYVEDNVLHRALYPQVHVNGFFYSFKKFEFRHTARPPGSRVPGSQASTRGYLTHPRSGHLGYYCPLHYRATALTREKLCAVHLPPSLPQMDLRSTCQCWWLPRSTSCLVTVVV
jgi:hypothetical protein